VERLLYYLILLLRKGQGVEICSKAANWLGSHPIQEEQLLHGDDNISTPLGMIGSLVGS
jgi:hypothetical protein